MATFAKIRKDLRKDGISIPYFRRGQGEGYFISGNDTYLVVKHDDTDKYDDEFYNTELKYGRKTYWVNSIDLDFFESRKEANLSE